MPDALAQLHRLPHGVPLERFLPEPEGGDASLTALLRRAVLASTLMAGLKMERDGAAEVSQDKLFGTVHAAPAQPGAAAATLAAKHSRRCPGATT